MSMRYHERTMGAFYVTIEVGDAQGSRFESVRVLADTGAAWTWIPKEILDRLGHKPTRKRRLQTADNRVIERDATFVPVRIGDETNPTLCIFGDSGSIPLLGATTMQEFSLAPDPVKEELEPTVGVLATILTDD
jgi:clan AA aspartic protease